MSKNLNSNATLTPIADALVFNNRFANVRLNAEQIGAESLKNWKDLMSKLHTAAYNVYVYCENNGLRTEDKQVDRTALCDALRIMLHNGVGEVQGHKLYINDAIITLIVGYAGKRGNKDDDKVKALTEEISKLTKAINAVDGMAGVNPEYVAELKAKKTAKMEEKSELLKEVDMRIKQPTMTTFATFCLDVEHAIARAISGQLAKSPEELAAEAEARRQARREKEKARKAAKKAENA